MDRKVTFANFKKYVNTDKTVIKNSDYTIPISQCDKRFYSNRDATGTIIIYLPKSVDGIEVGFELEENQKIKLQPDSADKMTPISGTAGVAIECSVKGSCIYLRGYTNGWYVVSQQGTWTGGGGVEVNMLAFGNTPNSIAISANGIDWTGLGSTIFDNGFGGCWNGSKFVAVGDGTNSIAYSSDGVGWTGITGGTIFNASGMAICWNGSKFIAVGQGTNSIAYSSDGISWTGLGTSIFSGSGYGVCWNGSKFIAVGQGTNSIAYSSDGVSWTGLGTSIFSNGQDVCWNGSKFVAVGAGGGTNSIAYSSDGIGWTGLGFSIFSDLGWGVCWNGSKFVAVGRGTNSIAYSSDGISWTGLGTSIFFQGRGVCSK